jgi:alpha-tubulin suppressor-like RCC1 family protein
MAIYRDLRRKRGDVETLIPEVQRIEKAMTMARYSINSGMEMPLPPTEQASFDSTPFNTNLNAVKADLHLAEITWESGLEILEQVKMLADNIYNAIPDKSSEDTTAHSNFVSSYNDFKSSLTTNRDNKINDLNALGAEWKQTLIPILEDYLNISLGEPVALADCSDRNEVNGYLLLDDSEPRAWKSSYATVLSSPSGPPILPVQAGTGSSEWHEYTAAYPVRLLERLNVYNKASQSAYASMSYSEWQALSTTVDPSQPYQILVLKRGSLNTMLTNLNTIRSEANRYYTAFSSAIDDIKGLEGDLAALQSKADAYRQFLAYNPGTVPDFEFDEHTMVTESDVPGISSRMTFAADGISVLETELLIAFFERLMDDFSAEIEEIGEQATNIGNTADRIAFDINRNLGFNDSVSSKLSAAEEMLDFKFDYGKDIFLGHGDYSYLFDSLEILDNDLWQHIDTRYYKANPPDIDTQIRPHVDYINSLGKTVLNRFAYLTEQIWSITDNLTFAMPEIKPNPWSVGTGFDAGESFVILAENKDMVDQFTRVRFLKYHKRPYTEPMGYLTLDEIRKGLPNTNEWVAAQTGGAYDSGLTVERVTGDDFTLPLKLKSSEPFTVRVVDSSGNPVSGVPVSLDYNPDKYLFSALASTNAQGLATFYPGPYYEIGDIIISFSVIQNRGAEGPEILAELDTTVIVKADTDGDGCSDEWETLYGFDPEQAFDGEGDFDGDGLTNAQEAALGTNPLNPDTDNDGYSDREEKEAGSDPLNGNDIPRDPVPEIPPSPVIEMRPGMNWELISRDIDIEGGEAYEQKFEKIIPFKDRIWAFGGNAVWSSANGYKWKKEAEAPEWAPRYNYSIVVFNKRLWVIGGKTFYPDAGWKQFSDIWVSDDGIKWTMVNETAPFGPRTDAHALSYDGSLWLIGGYLSNPHQGLLGDQTDIWKSRDGIQWTKVTASAPWPLRRNFSSTVYKDQLWIMGGDWYDSETGQTTFSDIWHSADGANWTMATDTPDWDARYGANLTVFNDRLWLFGGRTHTEGVFLNHAMIYMSNDGINWYRLKGPEGSENVPFEFKGDLWVYYDRIPRYMSSPYNGLYRSRGPSGAFSAEPLPADTIPATFSAGPGHVLAIKSDGTLWAWGGNHKGQLGTGNTEKSSKPLQIGTDTKWKAVSAGGNFSLGLKSDGTIWAWGQNYYGELGIGTNDDSLTPIQVGTDTDWKTIAAGRTHGLAIKANGTLWAWGHNNGGQLGDGTKTKVNIPIQVGTDADWIHVSAGSYHSIALKADGSTSVWGANSSGQLGTGTLTDSPVPVAPLTIDTWEDSGTGYSSDLSTEQKAVYAGASFSAALGNDGIICLWGSGNNGQLGFGSKITYYAAPYSSVPYDTWLSLSTGTNHATGIKNDNTLWAWGSIWDYKPEGVTYTYNYLPIPVSPDKDWIAVVSGGNFSIAQKADGSLWAWGSNGSGQLGNGTSVSSGTPVRVLALGPTEADTDGDWMDDDWEIQYFDNITRDGDGDFDEDGLTDFTEFQIGTRPDSMDSDNDGMPDKWEIDMGTNPLIDDAQGDQDNDGISNLDEYRIVLFRSAKDSNWGEIRWFGVSGNTLYFVDSHDDLLKAYDMTRPESPVLLGNYSESLENSGALRVKNNLLVIADGDANFQIIDITSPAAMTKLGEYILGGYIQGFDVSEKHICAADSDGALQIIDISDPANPVLKALFPDPGGFGKVFISGNRVYATLGGNLIQIIDITDPEDPALIGSYDAENLVWPPAIAVSGTIMAAAVRPMEEETSLKFIETSDPQVLTEIGRYPYYVDYIALSEGLLIASTGTLLDVVDVRNPAEPVRLGNINISPGYGSGLILSGNLLFLSHDSGVTIVDISRFRRPLIQAEKGDVNHDESVDLTDAILIIQLLAGKTLQGTAYTDADANNDGKLGIEELLFILQKNP